MLRQARQKVGVAIVLCLSFVVQACAAGPDANSPDRLFDMPIEDLMNMDVKTVSGASKHEQKITEAPASVTIVTREQIKRFGYRTLADILEGTRSFFTTYDRNYQYVGVRGFGRPADYNNRVLILLDGQRLNENIGGGSPVGADFPLDTDLIDRVEIIRGPGSSLYGTNALFAVVNVITKKAKDYNTLEVQGEVASFDTVRGRATYGKTMENGPDVLISATGFHSDGPTLHFPEFDDPSTHYGKVDNDGRRYCDLYAKASMDKLTLTAVHGSVMKKIPTAPWSTVFGDPRTRSLDERSMIGLTYEDEITEDFSVLARTSYSLYDYRGWYPYDESPDVVLNNDSWRGLWSTGELTFTNKLWSRHRLTWGTEFQYNQLQEQKNWDTDVYLFDSRHSWNGAFFAQDEYPLLDNLLLNAGVRFDDYVHQAHTTNPRLALIYKHSDATILKALYGTAFRAPTAYELYYQDGGVTSKANPDLRPEKIQTAELVLEQQLSNATTLTVSGFYYRLDKLIEMEVDPADGLLVFRNGDAVRGRGSEAEITRRWDSGLSATGSYSYTDAEYEDTGQRPANSPRHLAKLRVMVPLIEKKLFAGIETLYRGDVRTLSGNAAEAFDVTNLTFTYDGIIKNLDAALAIYNVFNTHYGYPGGAEHVQDILPQDGTQVALRLTYRF